MGNGVSKGGLEPKRTSDVRAGSREPNGEAKLETSTTIRPRLMATVEDSKTNQFIPFQSSVQGGNRCESPVEEGEEDFSDSLDAEATTTESADGTSRLLFGEVAIDLTTVKTPNPATPLRGSPRAKSPVVAERSSFQQQQTGKVHGLGVAINPWKHATDSRSPTVSAPPTNNVEKVFLGDFPAIAEGKAPSSAPLSWFSSPCRCAIPIKYTFAAFSAQPGPIRCLSASSDGTQAAVVVSGVKLCFLIDLQGTLLLSVKGHLDPVLSCAQSKDGKFLVTSSADCTAVMWDLNNGKKLRELPVSTQVNAVAVSDESEVVATTSTDDVVHVWDSKSADPLVLFQRHTAGIFSLSFSRRGNLVASGSSNGEIYVWSQQNGDVRYHLAKHKTAVLAVSFSNDGHRLASVDRESLRVWDLFTGQCVFCRDSRGNVVLGMDEELGSNFRNEDHSIRFTCCAFVAGQVIAVGLTSKQLLLVDPNEGKELLMIPTKALVTCVSGSWMADTVFIGDFAGNIYKLTLQYSARDIANFHLDQKPPVKESKKNAAIEKD